MDACTSEVSVSIFLLIALDRTPSATPVNIASALACCEKTSFSGLSAYRFLDASQYLLRMVCFSCAALLSYTAASSLLPRWFSNSAAVWYAQSSCISNIDELPFAPIGAVPECQSLPPAQSVNSQ